jgi:hypothetical protein
MLHCIGCTNPQKKITYHVRLEIRSIAARERGNLILKGIYEIKFWSFDRGWCCQLPVARDIVIFRSATAN